MRAGLYKRLETLRRAREEEAHKEVGRARRTLEAAQTRTLEAQEQLEAFCRFEKKEVRRLWEKVMGAPLLRRDLMETRQKESLLKEERAALAAEVAQRRTQTQEAQTQLAQARTHRRHAQRSVEKVKTLLQQEHHRQLKEQERQEEADAEEFALRRTALRVLGCFVVGLFMCGPAGAEFTPQTLRQALEGPVQYGARQMPLGQVFADVAASLEVSLEASGVAGEVVEGVYRAGSLRGFFDELSRMYQLDWYIYGQTLFVTPQGARRTQRLGFSSSEAASDFQTLWRRFKPSYGSPLPARGSSDGRQLIFEAPPGYLALVSMLYKEYQRGTGHVWLFKGESQEDAGVMVFRLRHAWAEDKSYAFSSGPYEVAGVASLLQTLTHPAKPQTSKPEAVPSSGAAPSPGATRFPVIIADARLNAVLVYDKLERYEYYRHLIRSLDHELKMVGIEAMIVDVEKSHLGELGVDWRAKVGKSALGFGSLGESLATAGAVALSGGLGGIVTALTSDLSGFVARVRALETDGASRIVSAPSVITMDNLEAVINTTQSFYVRVEGYQDSSLHPITASTTLRVTPHVIEEISRTGATRHYVQLFVSIDDGSIDNSEDAQVDDLPQVRQNTITTQAVVDETQALLIGGHINKVSTVSKTQVPFLGAIPVLGLLFRNSQTVEREFIRLFIIRPQVRS